MTPFLRRLFIFSIFIFPAISASANCPSINAAFTTSVVNICGPGSVTVNFTNTSTGAGAAAGNYFWFLNSVQFDNTSGLSAPTGSTISAVGTYNYMMVAHNAANNCTDTAYVTVTIFPIPTASFTFTPNNQCAALPVNFTSTSTGVTGTTTYLWNFGDATTSTQMNPTHTYAAGGTYNVTLTVTNFAGCTSTFNMTVTALTIPLVGISGNDGDGDTQYCLLPADPATTDVVVFSNTTTGATSYTWNFGDASAPFTTSSNANFPHTYTSYGTYTVTMTATGPNGCTATATLTVIFERFVGASFSVPITQMSGCMPLTVTPVNASANANTYVWNFGDATPPVTTNSPIPPTHIYLTPGIYTITLVASNSCNSATSTVSPIIVVGQPVVNFTATPALGCSPQIVTFSNTSTGAAPANNYTWNFGNGNTATNIANPPPQTYLQGTWVITLTASNACGTATLSHTIVVDTIPDVNLTAVPTTGCTPLTVTTNNTSTGGNLTYQWIIDGVLFSTAANIPPHVFTAPAGNSVSNHSIHLIVTNHCGSRDTLIPIVVHPAVLSQFNPLNSTICQGSSITFTQNSLGDNLTYAWNFGNGNTSTTGGPQTQVYNLPGTFTVTLVVTGFCGVSTSTATVVVNPMPVANISAAPLTGCEDLSVNFSNSSTLGATYGWNFGASASPTTSTAYTPPAVLFPNPGLQTIILTVTLTGCINRDTVLVTVLPRPVPVFTALPTSGCSPLNVVLNNTTTNSAGNIYTWDLGNGNTSSSQSPPSQTYIAGAVNDSIYTIELLVTNSSGCSDSVSHVVTVHPLPVAAISAAPLTGCEDLSVNFTDNSTLGATYSWNFGASAVPSSSAAYTPPTVVFPNPGVQTVILTVTRLGCIDRDTALITVLPRPVSLFTAVPTSGCSPLHVVLNNNTVNTAGNIYSWNLGNGNNSAAQNPPSQTYIAGVNDSLYSIKLLVTNSVGCSDSITHVVTVHPLPVASFSMNTDTVCALDNIIFTNGSTGLNIYNWNFGDAGTSTTTNPVHSYSTAGNYTVQLIATTNFGCKDTITAPVVVDPIPTVLFSSSVECVGDSTYFTNTSTGAITWSWNFGDATTGTLQEPAHLYASPGTYNVTLTAGNSAGCSSAITHPVFVNIVPQAAYISSTVCVGQSTAFTDQTTGTPTSWNWNFGDASANGLTQNPSHTYATAGSYNATLIVASGSGCSDTIINTVVVNPIPTAQFNSTTVCLADTTFFTSTSLGSPTAFTWNFGDATIDNTNNPTPSHVYASPGTYNVTLTAGFVSGCNNTITIPVVVHPRTVPAFTSNIPCLGGATNFTDVTTNSPVSWQWNFGDGSPLNNTQNPSHTYATPGTFPVTIVTQNSFGCTDSISHTITVYPLPVANFVADTVCEGAASSFTDNSTSAVSWDWNFGDLSSHGAISSPTHVYATQGTYTVTQIVTNAQGCTDTIAHTIVVRPNPVSAFTATTACHTYATIYTDNSTSAVSWQWNFGDLSVVNTNQSPSYIFANPGTYNTSLVVTNVFGCTDTSVQAINVLIQPQTGFTNTLVCAKDVVTFADTTTGLPSQWTWDFGDGSPVDANQNPTHIYLLGGNYNITLIAGNSAGCIDTLTTSITVNTVPVPAFTAPTVCLGNVTSFTDFSFDTAPITGYYWDFGDGNNSFATNPNYIYQNPGTYTVTQTVTNSHGCDSTITGTVIVTGIPVADFVYDTVCVGSATTFTDISTGSPGNWLWDFGDGNTSTTGPVAQHIYLNPGTYLASEIVSGGSGCTDQMFHVVTVANTVQAGMTISNPVCESGIVTFTDASVVNNATITDWSWDFGDGSPLDTLQNTSHVYAVAGTYTVTLSVTVNSGCTSVATQTLIVNPLPVALYSVTTACATQQSVFTDNSTGNIVSWQYDFGDASGSVLQNPTHLYPNSGSYFTSLIVTTAAGCSDTLAKAVTVFAQPNAAFSTDVVCFGDTTHYTDLSTAIGGTINSWNWDFNDGNTSTQTNPSHEFVVVNDSFMVSLIVTTLDGCIDTVTQLVTTKPIPEMLFGPDAISGCEEFTANFNDSSLVAGGTIVNWFWSFGDGNYSFGQSPVHTYTDSGSYYVTLSVTGSNGCVFHDSLLYPVVVYPKPVADFLPSPTSVSIFTPDFNFIDQSQGAMFWEWDFGDLDGSIVSNPAHSYADTGTYYVSQIVINQFGCRDTMIHPVRVHGEFTFFIPNAFTPNGNGNNEIFMGQGTGIKTFHFLVFDRWGNKLFDTTDPSKGWDGKLPNGEKAMVDVYVYKIYIHDLNEEDHTYIGHVSLIR
jgi:gliding motility-associated-like protein